MIHTKFLSALFISLICCSAHAQLKVHEDYVGGGHSEGLIVNSSSNFTDPLWNDNSEPINTINGEGLEGKKTDAARFLFQAAFGGTQNQIDELSETLDFEGWIDDQISLPSTNILNATRQSYELAKQRDQWLNGGTSDLDYNEVHFQYAWWHSAMTRPDILRQRIAFALSEIFVISTDSDIRNDGDGVGSYYNMLMGNAFGNFRELLEDVTYSPAMGIFLSHFQNQKSDEEANIFPDENYARELMQLFTIGLYELKVNGNLKMDANENPIQTYFDDDVRNLAKVLTGFGAGSLTEDGIQQDRPLNFNTSANLLNYTTPMVVYDEYHEDGEKTIFGDKYIPEGQTGDEDIAMALDYLFEHPNVGPFIARRLIQQLIKSNPSPSYINDVANAFNNNGDGIRGDMETVVKTILLHEEARTCLWLETESNGKLKSPVGRYLQFARHFADKESNDTFWTSGYAFENETFQLPLSSPSVFNFYLPDYQPNGEIYNQGLYAPEFQIYNSVTSLGYANQADTWSRLQRVFTIFDLEYTVDLFMEDLLEAAQSPHVLVNQMDVLLCEGRMSPETRNIITTAIENMNFSSEYLEDRVEFALYLTLISPDFTIQK
jgi:uncharacterized protein (DUF1800 family)